MNALRPSGYALWPREKQNQFYANLAPHAEPVGFKRVTAFCAEYTPLSYVIDSVIREGSLYTMTAKTGAGKTAFNIAATLAVSTGRPDILGREVTQGRVAYIACENPDDVRMRLMIAARHWGIDLAEYDDRIIILDQRRKPEDICAELVSLAKDGAFTLIAVDTLAAIFDGDDLNSNVQGGEFMRRLRPMTQINGKPTVLVSAHPIKNANEENLIPYGGGAILNEVDGNLTLWKGEGGVVTLHWGGKLRGLEFLPLSFQIEMACSPDILDKKGQQVPLPIMLPGTDQATETAQEAGHQMSRKLLRTMIANPGASQRAWMVAAEAKSVGTVNKRLKALQWENLVEETLGKWSVTPKGQRAANDA